MAHIIDDSCCKMRRCNKCDMYRKSHEALKLKCEIQDDIINRLTKESEELSDRVVKSEGLIK